MDDDNRFILNNLRSLIKLIQSTIIFCFPDNINQFICYNLSWILFIFFLILLIYYIHDTKQYCLKLKEQLIFNIVSYFNLK